MNQFEKVNRLIMMASTEDLPLEEDLAAILIDEAKWVVLNRRYPYGGAPDEVPARFESVQLQIAAELCNRIGTYGQTNHTADGAQRIWEGGSVSPSLLRQIPPLASTPAPLEDD